MANKIAVCHINGNSPKYTNKELSERPADTALNIIIKIFKIKFLPFVAINKIKQIKTMPPPMETPIQYEILKSCIKCIDRKQISINPAKLASDNKHFFSII